MSSPRIPRLYAIADAAFLGASELPGAVAELATSGFELIQLRLKDGGSDRDHFEVAESCVRILEGSEARLIINDRVDFAGLLPFAGVHLGQEDLPPQTARRLLAPNALIGVSCHDAGQVSAAEADPAVDLVAVGPIFSTTSKRNAEPSIGLSGLRALRSLTAKKLVAIGGIREDTLRDVLSTGADSVALIGALGRGPELSHRARRLHALADTWEPRV